MRSTIVATTFLMLSTACQTADRGPALEPQSVAYATPAEALSIGERAPTKAETERRERDCLWDGGRPAGRIALGDGLSAPVSYLPGMNTLSLLEVVLNSPASRETSIVSLPLLPRGGIANIDFCEGITMLTFAPYDRRGTVLARTSLRLRPGLNGRNSYPTAWPVVERSGRIRRIGPGCYAVIDLADVASKRWWDVRGQEWSGRQGGRPGFQRSSVGYLPVACP